MVLCVAGVTNYCSLTENHLKVWLRVFTHPLSRSLFTNTAFKMSHTCGCHLQGNTWKPGDFVPGEISQRKTDQIKDMPTAEDKIKPPGLALLVHFPIWSLLIRVLFLKMSVLLGILLLNHFSLFTFSFLLSSLNIYSKATGLTAFVKEISNTVFEGECEISFKKKVKNL